MPITASDLAPYGPTGRQLDDVNVVAGGIDLGARLLSVQMSAVVPCR